MTSVRLREFPVLRNVPYGTLVITETKNRSKGPVLIGLEEIVQRQVGIDRGRGG